MKLKQLRKDVYASNLAAYKEMNRVLAEHFGHPVHDDIEVFKSQGSLEQIAILAYRIAIDLSASSKVSVEKWKALITVNGEMIFNRKEDDINELFGLGKFLQANPNASIEKEGTAMSVNEYIVVKLFGCDIIFGQ